VSITKDYKKEARGLIEGRVLFDAPMKKYTSIKVGGPAECLLFPKNMKELRKVIRHARRKKIPVFILGKGTNLIVKDRGIRGWVVSLTQGMKKVGWMESFWRLKPAVRFNNWFNSPFKEGLPDLNLFPAFRGPWAVGWP